MTNAAFAEIQRKFRLKWADHVLSLLLAAGAWWLLLLWRHESPCPGEATRTVAELTGVWPRLSAAAPLWHRLAAWFCDPSSPEAAFRSLQSLARIFVALSVGAFHAASLRFLLGMQTEHSDPKATPVFCRIGAFCGTVLFLTLPPVWHAAQAPCAASLGILLCTIAAELAMRLAETEAHPFARLGWAAVTALALVETPVALPVLPVLLLFLLTIELGVERDTVTPFEEAFLPTGAPPSPDGIDVPEPPGESPAPDAPGAPDMPPPRGLVAFSLLPWGIFAALLLGTLLLAVLDFRPAAALYRHAPSFARAAVLFATDTASHISASLPSAEALAIAAFILLPAVTVFAISRRCLSGEQTFADSLAYLIVGTLLLVQTTRNPSLSLWTLLPSASLRAGFALVAAFLFAPCVTGFFVLSKVLWLRRRGSPEALEAGWEDPDGESRFVCTSLSRISAGVGIVLALVAVGRVAACRETDERAALAQVDRCTRDLALAIGPCRYFVSDGWNELGLRLVRPDVLTLPHVDAGEPLPPAMPGDRVARAALLPDSFSRNLFANDGWPALFGDWLATAPSNVLLTAFQTGIPLWRHAERLVPDLSVALYGMALHPVTDGDLPDIPDAEVWARRLSRLSPPLDPDLAATAEALRHRLQQFAATDFGETTAMAWTPRDYLESLPPPPAPGEPVPGINLDGVPAALESALNDLALAALTNPSPEFVNATFSAFRENVQIPADLLPETEETPRPGRRETEVENAPVNPTERLIDLVQAFALLRACGSVDEADTLLADHHFNQVLDPAFWYLWGLRSVAKRNAYGIMEAGEMLEKFPERAVLRSALEMTAAAVDGDMPRQLAAVNAILSDIPADLPLLRMALRLRLQTGPADRVEAARLAAPEAHRVLRYDATDPIAHLVLLAEALHPSDEDANPSTVLALGHLQRAEKRLPDFLRPLFQPLEDALVDGSIPPDEALPTVAELLDADRAALRRAPPARDSYHFHLGLLLAHFDPDALNSRYLIDPFRRQ